MSIERKIIRQEKKVTSILSEEIIALKQELASIKKEIESVKGSIRMHDDKLFSSSLNRPTVLVGIFSALNNSIKACNKEGKLGHLKNFQIVAAELGHLKDALTNFGRVLANPRPINSQKEALFIFEKLVDNTYDRVVAELEKSIRARTGILYQLKVA